AAVQRLCDRALLLSQGQLMHDGSPEECVSRYFNLHQPRRTAATGIDGQHPPVDRDARLRVLQHSVLGQAKSRHGERELEFVAATVLDAQGTATWDFELMHHAIVRVLLRARQPIALPSVGLQLHDRTGTLVYAAGTPQLRFPLPALAMDEEIMLDFRVQLTVQPGLYTLSLDAAEFDADDPNVGTFFDRVGGLGPLTVSHHAAGAMPFYGIAQLPMEIAYT
ncbi:MAG TPA: Wzt carbohydrate-binding domain-containing protein, partial [Candidatus Synoicihabitans sp.]|nr:Wzt carbohydrate-binding domain-containing protein [Candidatus Synoicihabitans sp.]